MDKIKTTEGDLIVRDGRFAIVATRFNEFIVDSLIKGARRCLRQQWSNSSGGRESWPTATPEAKTTAPSYRAGRRRISGAATS